MKTYVVKREYDRDLRVTVDGEVNLFMNYDDSRGVYFSRENGKYSTEVLGVFNGVSSVYLKDSDDIVVEEASVVYDEPVAQKKDSAPTITWNKV
jgi:hypothetical protein